MKGVVVWRADRKGAKGYLRVHLRAKMLRAASVRI